MLSRATRNLDGLAHGLPHAGVLPNGAVLGERLGDLLDVLARREVAGASVHADRENLALLLAQPVGTVAHELLERLDLGAPVGLLGLRLRRSVQLDLDAVEALVDLVERALRLWQLGADLLDFVHLAVDVLAQGDRCFPLLFQQGLDFVLLSHSGYSFART